jgi:uncharacterized protein YutE (UPF0331/DUF86 family)
MPGELDSVCFNKAAIIERSLRRMKEEYSLDPELTSFTHIDALTLNIQRACQASIDLALHLVAEGHSGIPQTSAEAFQFLCKGGIIDKELAGSLGAKASFRNIAIHEYQALDHTVLHSIAHEKWKDLVRFCDALGLKISV